MSNKNSEKLFGKWNELALLLIGFLLTGVVGSVITLYVQGRTWDHQYEEMTKREEIANAQKIFDEISSLMDSRSYLTRRLIWAYSGKKPNPEIEKRFKQYDDMLYDWNLNLNKRLSVIDRYFGNDSRQKFENEIHGKFRSISGRLDSLIRIKSKSVEEFEMTQDSIDPINTTMYAYNTELLYKIRIGKVGKFIEK